MKKILILAEVSSLSVRMKENRPISHYRPIEKMYAEESLKSGDSSEQVDLPRRTPQPAEGSSAVLSESQRVQNSAQRDLKETISDFLDEWEEPELEESERKVGWFRPLA
jgi:hypothetical protein